MLEGALAAGSPQVAAEPAVQEPRPYRVLGRVDVEQPGPGQGDGADRVAGQVGRLGGVLQHRDTIEAQSGFGIGDLVPQRERGLEVPLRVGESVGGLGPQARLHRGRQRAGRVVGPAPVVREQRRLGGPVGSGELRALGEHAGEGGVQLGPLARQQLCVQRLLGQRVPEGVGLGDGVGYEHLVGDRGAQRGEKVHFGQFADRREQLRLHPAAGRGHDPERGLGVLGKDLEAAQQDVLQARRQTAPVAVVGDRKQFLREERVALGAEEDPLDQLVVGPRPEDAGQQVGDAGTVEAGEVQPQDASATVQSGQERPQGMLPVQLVGAVGEHEQQSGPQVADEEREQVQGRAVRPVQVLHHQHGAGPLAEALQQAEERLEQPGLRHRAHRDLGRLLALPELRQQAHQQRPPGSHQLGERRRAELPAETAERLHHRRVRQRCLAELDATADQHRPAPLADPIGEPADQPGLPHTGFTTQAHRRRLASVDGPERRLEMAQLSCATDEMRGRGGPAHADEYALPRSAGVEK